VLIVSPDDVNRYGLPIVVPLTRTHKPWPMRVEIEGPLPEVCYAQCEQVRAVAASRMGRLYGQVDPVQMAQVEQVLRRLLGL
jgi:mRNA interferase MazF